MLKCIEMDKDLQDAILQSIALEGNASDDNKTFTVIIASRSHNKTLLSLNSGTPRFKSHLIHNFNLITEKPLWLSGIHTLAIRCCLCGKVINYPAWYYQVRYAVNWFHYFVCCNDKTLNAKCYRRGE